MANRAAESPYGAAYQRANAYGAAKDEGVYGDSNADVVPLKTACKDCCTECRGSFLGSLKSTITNRYFLSNLVYFIYAMLIVYIDQVAYPYANSLYAGDDDYYSGGSDDPTPVDDTAPVSGGRRALRGLVARTLTNAVLGDTYEEALRAVNNMYFASAIIHFLNAFMYAWSWFPMGFTWCSWVMIPEYLNMIGAALYLYTSTLYPKTDGSYTDEVTWQVHKAETAAAVIEVFAAFGWVVTWWLTFPRGKANRGWTFDDPDVWGLIFITVPSLYYVAYNAQILTDPLSYCCNMLYTQGDTLYAIGSGFYLLASLRDDGWLVCMPANGACRYGCDAVTPMPAIDYDDDIGSSPYIKGSGRKRPVCGCPVPSQWPCFGGRCGEGCNSDGCCKRKAEAQSLLGK